MADFQRMMIKLARILLGVVLTACLLYAATVAVRDCPTGPYVYENCLWLWVRDHLGLPQTKFGRAVVLELVGLTLLAGLYGTFRFVLPAFRAQSPKSREDLPADPV